MAIVFVPFQQMSLMQLKCPTCSKTLQVADGAAGKNVKCPCGTVLRVPGTVANPTPSTAARPAALSPRTTTTTPATARAAVPAAHQTSPRPAAPLAGFDQSEVSSLFDEVTVADMTPKKYVDPAKIKPKKDPLAAYVGTVALDKKQKRTGDTKDASKGVWQSFGILVFLGVINLLIGGFLFYNAEKEVALVMAGSANEAGGMDAATLLWVVRVVYGIWIGIGVTFLICAGLIFQFPMTCSCVALGTYTISVIFSCIANPLQLVSIRGWIFKAAIFGGLVQAINNASYYKFVKAGGRN